MKLDKFIEHAGQNRGRAEHGRRASHAETRGCAEEVYSSSLSEPLDSSSSLDASCTA